jgi:DnaJ-class molecular chaperone
MGSGNYQADAVERQYNRNYVDCPECNGSGLVWVNDVPTDEPCPRCDGLGEIPEDEIEYDGPEEIDYNADGPLERAHRQDEARRLK